jgi:hypothetical protein
MSSLHAKLSANAFETQMKINRLVMKRIEALEKSVEELKAKLEEGEE